MVGYYYREMSVIKKNESVTCASALCFSASTAASKFSVSLSLLDTIFTSAA